MSNNAATPVAYTSSLTTAFGGLTLADMASWAGLIAALIGIIFTVATFFVNWWYRRKEYKLKQQKALASHD